MKYTIFATYLFDTQNSAENPMGLSAPIHCNYINKIEIDNLSNSQISLYFDSEDDFPFMYKNDANYYGWSANRFIVLIQIINNETTTEIKPLNDMWRMYDVTNQIGISNTLTSLDMLTSIFSLDLNLYNTMPVYDLKYLSYPYNTQLNEMSFGDEIYFFGNVESRITAEGHRMCISLNLDNNKYNHTTNPTWDGTQDVLISEIGIYSEDGDLLAIGKFNKPISKNNNINRNITFEIDF